jgi:anti-sigma-K factor RskA
MAHPTPDDLALVALGEDVGPETTAHVAGCLACVTDVDALRHVVDVGRSLGPEDALVAPDPRVWQRVAAEVGSGPSTQAETPRDELAARRDRAPAPRRWRTVAVAAAAALVVGLGGGFVLRGVLTPGPFADTATQLNALPEWPGANGTAAVEDGSDGQRTLVVTMSVPAADKADGTFEVWMSDTRAEDMVSMGTMTGGSARFPVPAGIDLESHPVVDVSLEPPGDTDPHHSDVSVLRGRLRV